MKNSIQLTEKDKPLERQVMEESESYSKSDIGISVGLLEMSERISACSLTKSRSAGRKSRSCRESQQLQFSGELPPYSRNSLTVYFWNHHRVHLQLSEEVRFKIHVSIPCPLTIQQLSHRRATSNGCWVGQTDTATVTLTVKLEHATSSLTKEHDPVYLYGKACAHKHAYSIHVHRTKR